METYISISIYIYKYISISIYVCICTYTFSFYDITLQLVTYPRHYPFIVLGLARVPATLEQPFNDASVFV